MYYVHYTDCTTVCIDGTNSLHQGCAGPRRNSGNLFETNESDECKTCMAYPATSCMSVCVYAYGTCILVSEQRFVRHMWLRVSVYICLCVWQCECKHAHVCVRKMK